MHRIVPTAANSGHHALECSRTQMGPAGVKRPERPTGGEQASSVEAGEVPVRPSLEAEIRRHANEPPRAAGDSHQSSRRQKGLTAAGAIL